MKAALINVAALAVGGALTILFMTVAPDGGLWPLPGGAYLFWAGWTLRDRRGT